VNNKILCVDDEEAILRGFKLNLRNSFELHFASDGREGLDVFKREGGFAVVLSDMRMPQMSGSEMLQEIKKIDSEVVTVLLTGHTDFESAMSAVNDGNVFRMLSKPCPPTILNKTLKDALEQYNLVVSKRLLLDQTLRGAVDALAQSLSISQPLFFGRAQRVRRLANEIAELTQLKDSWRVGIAAIFSQLPYLSIPQQFVDTVYHKKELNQELKALVLDLPKETQKILELIPGLEDIKKILQRIDIQPKFEVDDGSGIRTIASILRLCLDYDFYKEQGHLDSRIIETFRLRTDNYDPKVVEALAEFLLVESGSFSIVEISTQDLTEGMRLEEDLLLEESMLIASAGADVDRSLLKIIRNYISCYTDFPFPQKIKVRNPVA
jgi:response regulator RpfG family c-di-GMP phosphodiesterase